MEPHPSSDVVAEVCRLLTARGARCGRHTVVAVDGRSGAGKTTFASDLATSLGADLLHLDDMYQGWRGLVSTVALVRSRCVEALAQGLPAHVPTWDWVRGEPGAERRVEVGPVLVLEGVGAAAATAGFASAVVWLEAPAPVRKERALSRDGETFAPWWETWAAQEDLILAVQDWAADADLRVDTSAGQR